MHVIPLLCIGFSLGCAVLLVAGNVLQQPEPLRCAAKAAGFLLIVSLAGIQITHLFVFTDNFNVFQSRFYTTLLYCVAPSFYFYSRQLLLTDSHYQTQDIFHLLPLFLSWTVSHRLALAGAFLVGGGYLVWLANIIYALRAQRQRFRLELLALAALFTIAVAVLLVGFVLPLLNETEFIYSYSALIGLAFFVTTLTVLRFPSLTADVSEAIQAAYAESTLKHIDKTAVLLQLNKLMTQDKLYKLETLNLALLAEQLALTQHQLSELINTQFQQGFSHYIRQQRIHEAKRLLIAEPNASVLSIGLAVGFNSQSNFYAAFRDIEGMAPGQYRKIHLA